LSSILNHQKAVQDELLANQPAIPTAAKEIIHTPNVMDEDLMVAFNEAGGHTLSQMLILQMQTVRRLDKMIELLTIPVPTELGIISSDEEIAEDET